MAESVTMALAAHVGKPDAHGSSTRRAAGRWTRAGRSPTRWPRTRRDSPRWLDRDAIDAALRAGDYLGVSSQFIGRVLRRNRRQGITHD